MVVCDGIPLVMNICQPQKEKFRFNQKIVFTLVHERFLLFQSEKAQLLIYDTFMQDFIAKMSLK